MLLELLVPILVLLVLDVLSIRFGANSHDVRDERRNW